MFAGHLAKVKVQASATGDQPIAVAFEGPTPIKNQGRHWSTQPFRLGQRWKRPLEPDCWGWDQPVSGNGGTPGKL